MGGEGGEPASEIGCEAAETSRSKQASEKECQIFNFGNFLTLKLCQNLI